MGVVMTVHKLDSIRIAVMDEQVAVWEIVTSGGYCNLGERDYWWDLLTPLFNQVRKEREEKASGTL